MDFSKLDNYLERLPTCGIPACDLAVTQNGKMIYRRGIGFSDTEHTRPVSSEDLYYVFSVSKITTCVAAMRLVEEKKLCLDDPVFKYLPSFRYLTVKNEKKRPVPAQNVLTVRHLFAMTGGFHYNIGEASLVRAKQLPDADTLHIVNAMSEITLDYEPGTRYQYGLCHDILAAVVEVVSGMRFAEYVQKTVLDPLGMTRTGYHLPESLVSKMSQLYQYTNGHMSATPIDLNNPLIISDRYDSGGAGLYSCVDDQIRLLTVLANGGITEDGYSLLKPETVAMMQVDQLSNDARLSFWSTRLYGYSWGLCGRVHVNPFASGSRSSIGEFGWDGAAGAFALVDPNQRLALYFGTHIRSCDYLHHMVHPTLRNLVYEGLK